MRGIVLLSGGLDSSVLPKIAKKECEEVVCFFIDYGQRTVEIEKKNSRKLANHYSLDFIEKKLPLEGGVVEDKDYGEEGVIDGEGVSTGYTPMRNLILLALAGNVAENIWGEGKDIFIYYGAQAGDMEAYPDCRPSFVTIASKALNESTDRNTISVRAPLMDLTDKEVLERAIENGVPLEYTFSCYNSVNGKACGECSGCKERKEIFEEIEAEDPIEYIEEEK